MIIKKGPTLTEVSTSGMLKPKIRLDIGGKDDQGGRKGTNQTSIFLAAEEHKANSERISSRQEDGA